MVPAAKKGKKVANTVAAANESGTKEADICSLAEMYDTQTRCPVWTPRLNGFS